MIAKHPVYLFLITIFFLFGVFIFVSAGTSQPLYNCQGYDQEFTSCTQLDPNSGFTCAFSLYCDEFDGWQDSIPLDKQWVDNGTCSEKEQKEQYYLAGTCSNNVCAYNSSTTRWVDTDSTKNVTSGNDPNNSCAASGCSNTGNCNGSGSCQVPEAGTDPNSACGSLSCSGYYAGWDSNTCYYKANIADNVCDGSSSCKIASNACPSQEGVGSAQITCSGGQVPRAGTCTGTTAGVCENPPPPADAIAPAVSANNASSSWFSSRTTTLSASDTGGSGLVEGRYNWDSNPMSAACTSGGTTFSNGAVLTVSAGSHRLYLCARDNAGNTNTWDSGANQYRVDSTVPNSPVIGYPDASPAIQSSNFQVGISGDGDTGGSGLSACNYVIYDNGIPGITRQSTARECISGNISSNSFQVTVGLGNDCRTPGSTCIAYAYAIDNAGNSIASFRTFGIKHPTQLPSNDFSFDPASVTVGSRTSVQGWLKDSAQNGIGGKQISLQCWVGDGEIGSWVGVASGTTATTGSVGYTSFHWDTTADWLGSWSCRLNFAGDSNYTASTSASKVITVNNPTLSYPSNTWQRLWYGTSGESPVFTAGNFKGEDLTQTAERFTNDWTGGVLPSGGQLYESNNNIGFQSSRTINSSVKGAGRFHVCSDDGMKLWVNNSLALDDWSDSPCGGGITVGGNIVKGDNRFRLDYYENTGNAKVEFIYWVREGLGLALDKSQYEFGENIALTAKYSGLDQRYAYRVYFTVSIQGAPANAEPGGATPCDILSVERELGDPRNNVIGTCGPTFTGDLSEGNHQMCAYLRLIDGEDTVDVNSDCVSFAVVPEGCTSDADCTQDPNKAYCNYGTSHNAGVVAHDTPNFLANTCIDSVPPTITIGEIKRTHSGLLDSKVLLAAPETPGVDPQRRQWLRDGIYEIPITVQDNVGGSNVDTSYRPVIIRSRGADDTFYTQDDKVFSPALLTYDKFNVWVGSSGSSSNDCVTQSIERCMIGITVRDMAGNHITIPKLLNIDYAAPSAQ